jgi:glycosyltransferase involved in cell wall biosynthesis
MLEPAREFVDAHNLTDVIKLPGLTRDSWTSLSAMDIFVLTSRIEGLPNVLIEAQGMGLPVICSGAGGMAETFIDGETGLTAEGAGEAMAAAARRLLSDPKLLRTMSKKAQKYARETFGLDRMVELTLDRYRDAIELRNDFVPSTESDEPGDIRLCAVQKWADGIYQAELSRTLVPFEWNLWEDSRIIAKGELAGESQEANPTRFEIVGNVVLFSTPDGSDPRFSGRTYRIRPQSAEDDYNTIPIPSTGMQPETGHCYVARLQLGSGSGRFELWEDSTLLGPGASLHDAVRQTGGGHYSVWGEQLYFSSSDNTDPRTNGRTYVLRRAKQTLASTIGIFELDATASMEQAIRHLVREAVPRAPYVPDRIVLVSGGLGPGGSERQVVYTLLGLAQQPYESVQLLCSFLTATGKDTHDFHLPTLQRARIPARAVRRQVGPNDLGSMPVALREVIKVLPRALATNVADFYWEFVELRPEIVHAWLDGNNVPAGLAAALAGVPKIFISGRNVNPSHFPYLHEPYMYAAYQALLSLPQVTMLNNSLAGRDDYAEWLGIDNNRICVVYNGVDFGDHARLNADEAKRLRAEFQLDEDAFVVGGIFRFAEEKRPLLWIETAADVARRVPEARFIIFGQGEMRTEMEAAAERLGIAERLIFGGITAEVLKVLSVMDVFLLTSALEGLPNVVLEAQWVGTPVVATRSGGTSEAVNQGTTGWIIESSSAQELADRIVWLHDNLEIRQAVRVEGPVAVKEKFGVDKMLRRTLELYGKVWPAVL